MITDATKAYFEKIRVRIKYKDEKNKKNIIGVICRIHVTEEYLQIISEYVVFLMTRGKYKEKFKDNEIPIITEENLYQFKDLVKKLKVKRRLLENFYFDLKKIEVKGFKRFYEHDWLDWDIAPSTLQLEIASEYDKIIVLLERKSFNPFSRHAKPLAELSEILKKFIKRKSMSELSDNLENSG